MSTPNNYPIDQTKLSIFQTQILNFWTDNGRKDLPWRKTKDPWQILIAEVLLRKTTSRQALKVFKILGLLSPLKISQMRTADLKDLLHPLGMYTVRAKQLHAVAEKVDERGSESLSEESFLCELPGVGRYISNAVLCFAFNQPKPALDTNMIRVIKRVFGVQSALSRAREDRSLWDFAERLVPHRKCRQFNWGVLDLSSSICKPRKPECPQCPLSKLCGYYKESINVTTKSNR